MADTTTSIRLLQLLSISGKEAEHLKAVSKRLFLILPQDIDQLREQLNEAQLIDTLESFSSKFSRMQDTLADKLIPVFLLTAGEKIGTVIENLNRVEKLELISDTQLWLMARGLRNKLVHEYIEDLQELLDAVKIADEFVLELVNTYEAINLYTHEQLKIK